MKFATIIVTRGSSCHVKTLHTILKFNILCLQHKDVQNELIFVKDDPFEKSERIHNCLKSHDRIFFIEFGVHVDEESLRRVLAPNEGLGSVVFPAVKEGIDWNMFKTKTLSKTNEPVHQMGLHFDTEVSTKISDDYYKVTSTNPKSWVIINKQVIKNIKDKRSGTYKIQPKTDIMFSKFIEQGVKVVAFTKARLTITYTHECISNIVNSASVKAS